MKPTAARVQGFPPSVFAEMTQLALQHNAVNLGQGFPDFDPPAFVLGALQEATAGKNHQYAPPRGLPRLQRALVAALQPQIAAPLDPIANVTVTAGATQALFSALQTLLEPGDEVIILEPQFDTYTPQVRLAGGVPRVVQLGCVPDAALGQRWVLDVALVRAVCGPRTKALLLNTPHNPTGKVFSLPELQGLAALAEEFDFYVIADEVYDRLVYDTPHVSMASLPNMFERTITVGSAGKTFSVTGWRVGWVIASEAFSAAYRAGHQWVTFCAPTPLQEAVAVALEQSAGYNQELQRVFRQKRELLQLALTDAGFGVHLPEAGYFMVADTPNHEDAQVFGQRMVTALGVAAMPMPVFHWPAHAALARQALRFAFCKNDTTLLEAGRRLQKITAL